MLSHYRVLDLTDHGALLCGQILADLGADVTVVEPPGGAEARTIGPFYHGQAEPNLSLNWWGLNRNKRGITVDLASEEGRQRLRHLARSADCLVESFEPGHLDDLGLGYERLAADNPRLVMVSITPFGRSGPKSQWKATDLTALAASSVLLMTGDDDRPPVAVAVPQAHLHAGAEAAVGALIALAGRARDGLGQHVDISVQTAAMMATQATALSAFWGERPTKRMAGGVNFGGIPLRFVNPASDGYVSVTFLFGSAIGPFSRRLMEVMFEEGIVDEATRDKDWVNYTSLLLSGQEPISELLRCLDAIARFTARHTRADLLELAMQRGLLIVPVNTIEDLARSPQLAERCFWSGVEHPELAQTVTYPGPFARFSASPITYRRRPPLLGEHNAEVLDTAVVRPQRRASTSEARRMPLEGLKVVDFMWVVAGPWGTRYLSDYGATVVRLESPSRIDTARTIGPFKDGVPGPERSGAFATVNAGKYGITLDLGHPNGRELALRLAAWADVVTESYAPDVMTRLGLDYESLKAVNPSIIMLSSSLNGQYGPHSTLAGFGTMGSQLAGFGYLAGWPDRPPAGPAGAYTDYISPKFTAVAILAALEHRRKTGEGQYIDFSQGEAAVQFLAPATLDYFVNGQVWERNGNYSTVWAPHGVYPAHGEDRWVAIVATDDEEWRRLCKETGHPEWLSDPRFATVQSRLANHEPLDALIAQWSANVSVDDIERRLQGAGVPVHRASASEDLTSDPQLAARGHFVSVAHPELGPVTIENSRMVFSATPASVTRPGPPYGFHNDVVLRELLGLDDEEVVELAASGALQ